MPSTAIVWHRRDLRVHDHPALTTAAREYERVVPVFVLDDRLLHGRFASASRTAFMLGCLRALDEALRARGARAVRAPRRARGGAPRARGAGRRRGGAVDERRRAVRPRPRRARSREALRAAGVEARPHPGSYLRRRVAAADEGRPAVLASSARSGARRGRSSAAPCCARRAPCALPAKVEHGTASGAGRDLGLDGSVPDPVARAGRGRRAPGARRAGSAATDRALRRAATTSRPAARACCRPTCAGAACRRVEVEARAAAPAAARGVSAFVRQLAWRDFYAHVLLLNPANARHEFQERFRDLDWDDDAERLAAWQEGRTGLSARRRRRCASSRRPAGCTTARGWSSARS